MSRHGPRQLLERVRSGDESAAEELFNRYVDQLIELAAHRLSPKLARRVDPEDIVQSAYRSFFRTTRAGGFTLGDSEQLWPLLAAITIKKAHKAVTRHTAQKRTVALEESTAAELIIQSVSPEALAREPSPEDSVALTEETERLMSRLLPPQRQMVQLRLQGYTIREIAEQSQCSQRTVHRALDRARRELETSIIAHHRDG